MRTNTAEYINTWGKRPSGKGLWFLELTGTDGQGRFTTYQAEINGTLTEAKRIAAKNFKAEVAGIKTITEITVMP